MENITEPENNVSGSKVSRKSFFIKLFFILIVLVILGILGFVFRDRLISKLKFTINSNSNNLSGDADLEDSSAFSSLVEQNAEPIASCYHDISEKRYLYKEFNDGFLTVTDEDNNEYTYPLKNDFLLFCYGEFIQMGEEKIDTSLVVKSYESDSVREEIEASRIKHSESIPLEHRRYLLENYEIGRPVILRFVESADSALIEYISIYIKNPEDCFNNE